jgi:2-hydroxycyclohexanecarboxyl-CoA dehydrogenase
MSFVKTVVLTGGASGIGRATALLLAERGARVIVGDIDEVGGRAVEAKAIESKLDIRYARLDLSDPSSVDHFAKVALEIADGRVDGLVNAAGWDKVEPFLKNTPDLWDKVMSINLMGAVRLTHSIVATMIEANSGKIVNVSSDAGRVGSMGETVYAAAKGGMIAFTKSLARETARYKLNVNCVCPGPTDTPLFHAQPDERIKDALIKAVPFRRLAKPEEIGAAIAFFLSDDAVYITGQVLSVSGGLTMVG